MGDVETASPVSSHNEWDPLEEVIVGDPWGAMVPELNEVHRAVLPPTELEQATRLVGGAARPYPQPLVELARSEAAELVRVLGSAGVTVRRPEPVDHGLPYATPAWSVPNGFCGANPRDVLLVVGDQIIEAPMADRSRYFEAWQYRPLLRDYFRRGARWVAAPKPQLLDAQFASDFEPSTEPRPLRYVTTEFEPTFDAADFVRCGRDIFGQRSNVTNIAGIEWLQRHLGDAYTVHPVESRNPHAMHIDDTLMPLAPGRVLVNPAYLDPDSLPDAFRKWDVLIAPEPVYTEANRLGEISGWVNMNVLMLDSETVIVERSQAPMLRALERWGFRPVPCAFEAYYLFAGSFHCATLDVRRRGELESYF